MSTEPPVIVVFRCFQGEIVALMPEIPHSDRYCTCYAHVGQHSGADYRSVIGRSRPATQEEYAPLLAELRQIGYHVAARQRYTRRRR